MGFCGFLFLEFKIWLSSRTHNRTSLFIDKIQESNPIFIVVHLMNCVTKSKNKNPILENKNSNNSSSKLHKHRQNQPHQNRPTDGKIQFLFQTFYKIVKYFQSVLAVFSVFLFKDLLSCCLLFTACYTIHWSNYIMENIYFLNSLINKIVQNTSNRVIA